MQHTSANDLSILFKESFDVSVRADNVVPLLVDALLVATVGLCSLGVLLPALFHGYTAMCLRAVRGEKISVGESFRGIERFASTFVLGLLLFALLLVGTLLPLVGHLAVLCVVWWAFCASVERPELGALDAVKASFAFTRAHLVETLAVVAVGVGLNMLLAATVLGAIASAAFSGVLTAVVWSRLSRGTSSLGYAPRV